MFVFDRQRRVTRRVSTNANLVSADDHSRNPAMSLSGRFVVFESFADNLAGGNPGTPLVPISDIFLHDRDTDGDGVFDESGGIDTQLVSANRCQPNLTNHSIEPSITYDGRFVVFATVAGNAKVDENCNSQRFQPRPRHLHLGPPARHGHASPQRGRPGRIARRQRRADHQRQRQPAAVPDAGGQQRRPVRAKHDVASAVVDTAVSGDGKSTTGEVPSPTTDTPPPADVPPPPPTGSTEDPATSGDGNTTGNTTEPDPGTGEAEPVVEVEETPADGDGTPSIAGALADVRDHGRRQRSSRSRARTSSQAARRRCDGTARRFAFTFVNSALVRVTAPPSPTGFDGPVSVRVVVNRRGQQRGPVQLRRRPDRAVDHVAEPGESVRPGHRRHAGHHRRLGLQRAQRPVRAQGGTVTNANANSITVTAPAAAAIGPGADRGPEQQRRRRPWRARRSSTRSPRTAAHRSCSR